MSDRTVLQCFDISVRFGGVRALEAVSFLCRSGAIVGIVGGNGSGKSTLLNAINGLQRVTTGRAELNGFDITHLPAWNVSRRGVTRAFQAPRLPDSLPVTTAVEFMLGRPSDLSHLRQAMPDVWTQFEQCGLRDRNVLCGQLPFGDKKMVALLAALLSPACLVLLDEPFAGLDSNRIDLAVEAIRKSRSPEKAIILVEHGIRRLLTIADKIVVLDQGRLVTCGAVGAAEVEASLAALNLV